MSGRTANPWRHITSHDYEGRMRSPGVGQQPVLEQIFAELLARYRPSSLAVPGSRPGIGFRHIDPTVTTRVLAAALQ